MTNKTDNDELIYKLRSEGRADAADALQAVQEENKWLLSENNRLNKTLMHERENPVFNGKLDSWQAACGVARSRAEAAETKLAAIREAAFRNESLALALLRIREILNTTNAQPKKDVIAGFVNSQQEVPIEIQEAIFSNIDKLIDETNAQPAQGNSFSWECNECGAREYTSAVTEADIEKLRCGSCGGTDFHKEYKPAQEQGGKE